MNFSEDFLMESFRKRYEEALYFKNVGNLVLAKSKFSEAADYMDKLAFVSSGEVREERLSKAARLRALAEAINASVASRPAPRAAGSGYTGTTGYTGSTGLGGNSGSAAGGYAGAQSDDVPDETGMEEYLTFYTADDLVGFESVIGLADAKKAVTQYVINPALHPESYNYDFIENKAILLEGPPGTGKTTFAKAVAAEINQPFALVNVAALVNCYVGETSKNIDKVFAYLRDYTERNNCGVTVFFDELDEIAKRRGGDDKTSETAVPALLRNLDGVKKNKNFLILANTNRKDVLDSGILERFRKQIYIPLPDAFTRKCLFEAKLKIVEDNFKQQLDFGTLSDISEGLSGRDITFICDDFKYYLSELKSGLTDDDDVAGKLSSLIAERRRAKELD